ncbi:hypothetical protein [Haloferula sp. BvORR071]|uniref:hypothetical protein n=1 Tax=Haloferula sp. BvORR071 TaxID=1396141 RepID=UPI00055793B9|nr:hypothetical protein [Haloferula sp. BvORR071]
MEDAGAALEWYRAQEATWEESQTYFHLSAFNFEEPGNSHGPVVPMLAPVYEAWLEKRPGLALAYLENSIGAQREPFQYLVKWTELPDETKIGVLAIMPGGEKKDNAAVSLAGRVRWTKSADHKTRVARLDEIARLQGLGAGTLAEIGTIKEELDADGAKGNKRPLNE